MNKQKIDVDQLVKCEYCKQIKKWYETIETPFSHKTVCLVCMNLDKVK